MTRSITHAGPFVGAIRASRLCSCNTLSMPVCAIDLLVSRAVIDLVNGDSFHVGSSALAAVSGYPNVTVPAGQVAGLPIGLSFMGKPWNEKQLIEMAYAFEQATGARYAPDW